MQSVLDAKKFTETIKCLEVGCGYTKVAAKYTSRFHYS